MRLGVMIDSFNVGGVEKIAINETNALQQLGHDASLVVLSRRKAIPEQFSELLENINVIYLDDRLSSWQKLSFKIPFFSFFSLFHLTYPLLIPEHIKKNEFDYIISHNSYTSLTALAISRHKNIPYGLYVHDQVSYILSQGYPGRLKRLLFKPLIPLAKYVDKKLISEAKNVFIQNDELIQVVKAQMDDQSRLYKLTPSHEPSTKPATKKGSYFLMATAWKNGKNIEGLLESMAPNEKVKLKLAGKWIDSGYRTTVEKLIAKRGLIESVELVGGVTETQLNALHRNALGAIITSREKGFGMPALEAAANGTTFIIPEDCGAAHHFRRDTDGFFYKYGDFVALQKYMAQLSDEDLAMRMGRNAWDYMRTRYTWKNHSKILEVAIGASISEKISGAST